jgi:hypothetical protein
MGPDDLLCSRNARNKNVLAWDKNASLRARGWVGENVARNRGSTRLSLKRKRRIQKTRPLKSIYRATTVLSWGLCEQEKRSACSFTLLGLFDRLLEHGLSALGVEGKLYRTFCRVTCACKGFGIGRPGDLGHPQ